MCVCMCGKLVRKEGMGRHREETPYSQQIAVPKLQSKPDLFCRLSVFLIFIILHCEQVGECASWKLHRRETTTRSQQSLSSDFACTNLYMKTVMYIHHFIYLLSV